MEAPGPSGPGWRAPRRIATTPISLYQRHEAAAQSSALVETLYYHPNIKIVSFTASARAISRSPSRGSDGVDKEEVGTLSWSSQLERTIAVGPFRIYRAPASVAFLSCGSALQPILPKSQSWCLDEANSRFILQIRRPNYWRLELPVDNPDDQQLAQDFRGVLDSILQFEKTPCPFKRAFTVLLPEVPQEPVKKKPWKPVRRSLPDMVRPPSTTSQRPIDAATTYTAQPTELTWDDSKLTASPGSRSRERSSVPAPIMENSAGLSVLARDTRSVSDSVITVSTLVKQFDERSENDIPTTPTMGMGASSLSTTPDSKAESPPMASITSQHELAVTSKPDTPPDLRTVEVEKPEANSVESKPQHQELQQTSMPKVEMIGSHEPVDTAAGADLEIHVGAGIQNAQRKVRLRRSTGFGSIRQIAPARRISLNLATPASEPAPPVSFTEPEDPGDVSSTESEDSFHSVESWHVSEAILPPSPPTSQSDSLAKTLKQSFDDTSDVESETSERSVATAPDDSLTVTEDQSEDMASEGDESLSTSWETRTRPKHRAPASSGSLRRRALSPLPPAASIYSPPVVASRSLVYNNRLETMKKIPMAIITKTCSMFLGPPLHLVALMLKVAGKIAAGQWRGQEYGYGADGEQIPVQWDYSDGDLSDSGDDY